MILCIGTTPAVQRVMLFPKLALDRVNRATTTLEGAAGKSINVAKVLKALGADPVATGFLGGDRGDFLRSVLKAKEIETDFVTVAPRTRQCLTVIDEAAGTQTELVEESAPVPRADYQKLMAIVKRRMHREARRKLRPGAPDVPARSSPTLDDSTYITGGTDPDPNALRAGTSRAPAAVIMSGTLTPGGPPEFYFDCANLARAAGAFAVVDAQGPSLIEALKARPSLVKPNRAELAATFGSELKNEKEVRRAMRELGERGAERVVVTSGKNPSLAFDGQNFWKIFNPTIKAINPIGSGDAFTAGLVWRLLRGDDLGEACRWAAATGAANALTLMAGEVNRKDVERLARKVELRKLS